MPPTIDYYSNISREEAVRLTVALHRAVGAVTSQTTRANYRIELTALILSVLTSGAIWVVVDGAFHGVATWVGAASSTLVTGLSIYQFTLGPRPRVKQAYVLYEAVGKELAHLRGATTFDQVQFWDKYKAFEFDLEKLENPSVN
jgi:hypothetical protein